MFVLRTGPGEVHKSGRLSLNWHILIAVFIYVFCLGMSLPCVQVACKGEQKNHTSSVAYVKEKKVDKSVSLL